MKKFALALTLLLSALSFNSQPAKANGATVVFKQIRFSEYFITPAVRDNAFNTSKLFNVLESSANDLYVARLDPVLYRWVSYYASQGDDVVLPFAGFEEITFRYFASWRSIIGVTADEEVLVLLPKLPEQQVQKPIVQKPLETCDDEEKLK